eukprot:3716271-Rhodomonas_salina.1
MPGTDVAYGRYASSLRAHYAMFSTDVKVYRYQEDAWDEWSERPEIEETILLRACYIPYRACSDTFSIRADVSSYAVAMRCPRLRYVAPVPGGSRIYTATTAYTAISNRTTSLSASAGSDPPTALRTRYAVSGTDLCSM